MNNWFEDLENELRYEDSILIMKREYEEYLDSLENNEECFDCYSDEIN